jgi:hypothetical protein
MKNVTPTRRIAAVLTLCFAFAAGATAADAPSSGFLAPEVEAKLGDVELSDGRTAKRWISSDLNKQNYNAVMVDRVLYYPAPNPGPQVSSSALEDIADYLTDALRRHLGESVKVVDKGGPGVLRMQPAITAVTFKQEGLSAMDVVPVHLLFTSIKKASGEMDETVKAMVEVRITDSVSTDYVAAMKMDIKGEKLKSDKDQLTVENFKKALDHRAKVGADSVREALSK